MYIYIHCILGMVCVLGIKKRGSSSVYFPHDKVTVTHCRIRGEYFIGEVAVPKDKELIVDLDASQIVIFSIIETLYIPSFA